MIAQEHSAPDVRHSADRLGTLAAYGLAGLLAILFFFTLYPNPVDFLIGNGAYFEMGDTPQHVSGWLLYAKDSWRWPLLSTQMISPQQGSHIALTDSIPLAALLFKPIAPFLWENFHYFGLWHLGAKILQATGAVFLIRALGHKTILAGLVAAALALMSPSMLFRLQHTALMSHGLLLFTLGFYFGALRRDWSLRRLCLAFAVLILLALLVHPYLVAMVFPLFLAASWDRWGGLRHWRKVLATIGIVTVSVAVPAILLGYGSAASSGASGGFDIYSMNLLAPFCGGSLSPCGFIDATGGQYEGFNYLGLGTLLIIAAALVSAALTWRSLPPWVSSHAALVTILTGLVLYALSGHIFLGMRELVALQYPFPISTLSTVFRASGRFFWPVGYAALFLALAAVLRLRAPVYLTLLPLALMLQWLDTEGLRRDTRSFLTSVAPFDYSGWSHFQGEIHSIKVTPEYGCAAGIENMRYVYFQMVAARLGVPINTAYQARTSSTCSDPEDIASQMEPGVLRVNLSPSNDEVASADMQARLRDGTCWQWTGWHGLIMCLPGSSEQDWAKLNIAQ